MNLVVRLSISHLTPSVTPLLIAHDHGFDRSRINQHLHADDEGL
ncbi:hypothetical protein ACLUEY_09760 [Vreelandella aquamarina]